MPIEVRLLGWTLALAFVQIMLAARVRTRDYGLEWNMGARDREMPPPSPLAGRLARAQANLFETLPLFGLGVLACFATARLDGLTTIGAWLYFGGRLAYLPLYALGVPLVRSLVWGVSTLGMVLILWTLLKP